LERGVGARWGDGRADTVDKLSRRHGLKLSRRVAHCRCVANTIGCGCSIARRVRHSSNASLVRAARVPHVRAVDARALPDTWDVRAELVHAQFIHAAGRRPVVDALVDIVVASGTVELRRARALEPEHTVLTDSAVDARRRGTVVDVVLAPGGKEEIMSGCTPHHVARVRVCMYARCCG
jgi:hypothetical protein